MKLYDDLKWRGLFNDITSPDLENKLNEGGMTFYIGIDPTGDSMHIGHYSSVVVTAKRLLDGGHKPIIIAGGGTGLIGDPKPNAERAMISKENVLNNIECLKNQISELLKTDVQIVNNADWLLEMNAIDYLRDYGKYFSINYMLAKDTVKRRLDIGITYTEFSYMILQSIDFLKLYENYGCTMQIGGQDQWGNITSGLELIRKVHGSDVECYGFTMPLITRADGSKFGKSESGEALWLDINRTSAYEMYQYFINVEDSMVIEYLKKLTFVSRDEILEIEKEHSEKPEDRSAQRRLAKEIIEFIHGSDEFIKAKEISESLFSTNIKNLKADDIINGFKGLNTVEISSDINIIDLLVDNNICSSKREAREMVSNGAISINNDKVLEESLLINKELFIEGKVLFLRKGKKNQYLVLFS